MTLYIYEHPRYWTYRNEEVYLNSSEPFDPGLDILWRPREDFHVEYIVSDATKRWAENRWGKLDNVHTLEEWSDHVWSDITTRWSNYENTVTELFGLPC